MNLTDAAAAAAYITSLLVTFGCYVSDPLNATECIAKSLVSTPAIFTPVELAWNVSTMYGMGMR
jgi:hypothetical protein